MKGVRQEPVAISAADAITRRKKVVQAMPGLFSLVPKLRPQGGPFPDSCWKNGTKLQCVPSFFLLGQGKKMLPFVQGMRYRCRCSACGKSIHEFWMVWFACRVHISSHYACYNAQHVLIHSVTGVCPPPTYMCTAVKCGTTDLFAKISRFAFHCKPAPLRPTAN